MTTTAHSTVAIVGAGIAGLRVATELVARGIDVAVFESRDRVGGRLLSTQVGPDGMRLDHGATWFWPGEQRVMVLVEQLGIPTHPQHLAGDAVFHEPGSGRRVDGNPIDVPSWRFSNGAQSLPERLAEFLPGDALHLSNPITAIRTDGDSLIVEHQDGLLACAHVVLAVAPALALERIEFAPPLPARISGLAELTPVWMGSTVKVVARYQSAFWRDAGLSGSGISHIGPLREIHDMSGPNGSPAALFGFAPQLDESRAPSKDVVVSQLVEMFGTDAAEPLEVVISDWRTPDTSPRDVVRLTAYQAFGHPLFQSPTFEGRLHWASTETASVAPGHIEGALEAADRTVDAIAKAL